MTTRNAPAPCFFALSESRDLGELTCREAGLAFSELEERQYEGGEFKFRPRESVRGRQVFVLQTLAGSSEVPVAARLMRLLFLLRGLRDGGAEKLIVLTPYLAFARQDRRSKPRDMVNTRYVAELLETAGAHRVVAIDVHNESAFDNAFRVPTDHLTVMPMLADHFARHLQAQQLVITSPDIGGIKRAQMFRELLAARTQKEVGLVFTEKRRVAGKVSGGTLVGEVAGCHAILLDDLCATGGTLIRAAEVCRGAGATAVHAAVTHMPIGSGLEALLQSEAINHVLTTDSVGVGFHAEALSHHQKLVWLSVAPLLGQAVRRMLDFKPLAPLLSQWPLEKKDL
jgi:ribose-phosphate pyrophosphokinase